MRDEWRNSHTDGGMAAISGLQCGGWCNGGGGGGGAAMATQQSTKMGKNNSGSGSGSNSGSGRQPSLSMASMGGGWQDEGKDDEGDDMLWIARVRINGSIIANDNNNHNNSKDGQEGGAIVAGRYDYAVCSRSRRSGLMTALSSSLSSSSTSPTTSACQDQFSPPRRYCS